MEVNPDLFEWLKKFKIFSNTDLTKIKPNFIPSDTLALLLCGKYIPQILLSLESTYNNYTKDYQISISPSLLNIIPINENNQSLIPNNIKYKNWSIIREILSAFKIKYSDNDIVSLSNGNKGKLIDILNSIRQYEIDLKFKSNKFLSKNTVNDISQNQNTQNTNNLSKINESSNKKNYSLDSIDIFKLNPQKKYTDISSPLEFFIISLCKNLKLKPRQVIALLADNRNYLTIMCNKGLKGNYTEIFSWLNDIKKNYNILSNQLQTFPDGLNISYAIIGTCLCSRNETVCLTSVRILNDLFNDYGIDWDWMVNEGIDNFIYAIIIFEPYRKQLVNILLTFVNNYQDEFINELKKKIYKDEKKKLFEFCSCILFYLNEENSHGIIQNFIDFILDLCFNEAEKLTESVSLLSETLYYFHDLTENFHDNIVNYIKNCIKSNNKNIISVSSIAHLFSLIERFSAKKNELAPLIYQVNVEVFIDNFGIEEIHNFFLSNFLYFFSNNQSVPIDILFNPYLKKMESSINLINLNDLIFLFKLIDHPRITNNILAKIIPIILKISLNNYIYSRSANIILSNIFQKKMIDHLCTDEQINEITITFIDHITETFKLFNQNIENNFFSISNIISLESAYDIIIENFSDVNVNIHDALIDTCTNLRKKTNKNSTGLLAMLWVFDDHDDFLLRLEEEMAIINMNKNKSRKGTKLSLSRSKIESKKFKKTTSIEKDVNKSLENLIGMTNISTNFGNDNIRTLNRKYSKIFDNDDDIINYKDDIEKGFSTNIKNDKRYMRNPITLKPLLKSMSQNDYSTKVSSSKIEVNKNNYISQVPLNRANPIAFHHKPKLSPDFSKGVLSGSNSYSKKKDFYRRELKYFQKLRTKEGLIRPEGTVIKNRKPIYTNTNSFFTDSFFSSSKATNTNIFQKFNFNQSNDPKIISNLSSNVAINSYIKNNILPINFQNEEERESIAIDYYNRKFSNQINSSFVQYSSFSLGMSDPTITKEVFFQMLRECGFKQNEITNEELEIIFKILKLSKISFEDYKKLLLNISYIIYIKKQDTLPISECYRKFLVDFTMSKGNFKKVSKNNDKLKHQYCSCIDLLTRKMNNPIDNDDKYFNIPPGFVIKEKTELEIVNKLPKNLRRLLGSSHYICYSILNDILYELFSITMIEPVYKFKKVEAIDINFAQFHKWSVGITNTYIELNFIYRKVGIVCADVLDNMINFIGENLDLYDRDKGYEFVDEYFGSRNKFKANNKENKDKSVKYRNDAVIINKGKNYYNDALKKKVEKKGVDLFKQKLMLFEKSNKKIFDRNQQFENNHFFSSNSNTSRNTLGKVTERFNDEEGSKLEKSKSKDKQNIIIKDKEKSKEKSKSKDKVNLNSNSSDSDEEHKTSIKGKQKNFYEESISATPKNVLSKNNSSMKNTQRFIEINNPSSNDSEITNPQKYKSPYRTRKFEMKKVMEDYESVEKKKKLQEKSLQVYNKYDHYRNEMMQNEIENNRKFELNKNRRIHLEEDHRNKFLEDQNIKNESREIENKRYLTEQKKKLIQQFKNLKAKRDFLNKKKESSPLKKLLKTSNSLSNIHNKDFSNNNFNRSNSLKILYRDNYINKEIKGLFKRKEIKDIFKKNGNRLNLLFHNYSVDEQISIDNYSQLLFNFNILDILISNKQLQYTFDTIKNGKIMPLNYDEFLLSLLFLSILSNNKKNDITSFDIGIYSEKHLDKLLSYFGFETSLNKREFSGITKLNISKRKFSGEKSRRISNENNQRNNKFKIKKVSFSKNNSFRDVSGSRIIDKNESAEMRINRMFDISGNNNSTKSPRAIREDKESSRSGIIRFYEK